MLRYLALGLVVIPCAVNAALVYDDDWAAIANPPPTALALEDRAADFMWVEYAGTVTGRSGNGAGYSIGDSVSGTLLIRLRFAPEEDLDASPLRVFYANNSSGDSRFVTGFAPFRRTVDRDASQFVGSSDLVQSGEFDHVDSLFHVKDNERTQSPTDEHGRYALYTDLLELFSTVSVSLTNNELVQSFDLRGPAIGTGEVFRRVEYWRDDEQTGIGGGFARLVLQRLTVTPGYCSR